jgi:mono/diheme cytochrome c family protein
VIRSQVIVIGLLATGLGQAQTLQQGEALFAQTCSTGYCHGAKGTASGAPRLAGRGFGAASINQVVSRGVPGTSMPAFAARMPPQALAAVVAYVGSLNGIAAPNTPGNAPAPAPTLSAETARGAQLF